MKLICVYWR